MLPAGVGTLLPNLQELQLQNCALTPAARTTVLDVGCSRLRALVVQRLLVQAPTPAAAASAASSPQPGNSSVQQLATAQLRQLANLPSLNNVNLEDDSCPTLFLVALGTQLTRLKLHAAYQQCLPGTQTPTPAWRNTLQHVARCTQLRDLHVPCATAEELGLVAPALQQLRTLWLTGRAAEGHDGDAVAEVLLGLPHLTDLFWPNACAHTFQRWHNDKTCRWEQLNCIGASFQQLARLPLHSLKRPLLWSVLIGLPDTPMLEVRAAVANVMHHCPAGFRWGARAADLPQLYCTDLTSAEASVPAVLRALQPLFASLAGIKVKGVRWDAVRVKALGEVLPHTCTRLVLLKASLSRGALEQVARSLPWLRRLESREQEVSPEDVEAYVHLVRRLKEQEGGAVRLEDVVVERPVRPQGASEKLHKRQWEQAVREVRERGGGVALRVAW